MQLNDAAVWVTEEAAICDAPEGDGEAWAAATAQLRLPGASWGDGGRIMKIYVLGRSSGAGMIMIP